MVRKLFPDSTFCFKLLSSLHFYYSYQFSASIYSLLVSLWYWLLVMDMYSGKSFFFVILEPITMLFIIFHSWRCRPVCTTAIDHCRIFQDLMDSFYFHFSYLIVYWSFSYLSNFHLLIIGVEEFVGRQACWYDELKFWVPALVYRWKSQHILQLLNICLLMRLLSLVWHPLPPFKQSLIFDLYSKVSPTSGFFFRIHSLQFKNLSVTFVCLLIILVALQLFMKHMFLECSRSAINSGTCPCLVFVPIQLADLVKASSVCDEALLQGCL